MTPSRRVRWRRLPIASLVLVVAAVGLGLVVPSTARASCAGPQLVLEQAGVRIPQRRVGEGEDEVIVYDVAREPLRVDASNLAVGCEDTPDVILGGPGCGERPAADPVEPIVPMQNIKLVLTQAQREWTVGAAETVRPDLTAQFDVTPPRELRPGPARLRLVDPDHPDYSAQVELVVR